MKRAIIAGGKGLVGSGLIEELIKEKIPTLVLALLEILKNIIIKLNIKIFNTIKSKIKKTGFKILLLI